MNFTKIIQNLQEGIYDNKLEYPSRNKFKKLDLNYVFDENLSVKNNREKVLEHNAKIELIYSKYKDETIRVNDLFFGDIILALKNQYGFNEKVSEKIYHHAYSIGHSSGKHEVVQEVLECADFVEDILELGCV